MVTTSSQISDKAAIAGVEAGAALTALSAEKRLVALLAGARARGVADALDLLGVAAVLVDGDGAALNVNTQAAAFMGPDIGICAGQLVAGTYEANTRLQRALDCVLNNGGVETVAIDAKAGSAGGDMNILNLHILGLPQADDPSTQLLKAVIILESRAASCGQLALAARILRQSARLN